MKLKSNNSLLLLVLLMCCPLFHAGAEELNDRPANGPLRTWTDRTGDYNISARFVSFQNEHVQLRRTDGVEIKVPISLLCDADRTHVSYQLRKKQSVEKQLQVKTSNKLQSAPNELAPKLIEVASSSKPTLVNAKAERIYGIDWYNTPESLAIAAGQGTSDQKPVALFRILGDLEGFM